MNEKRKQRYPRRWFLGRGVRAAGLAGMGGAVALVSRPGSRAAQTPSSNPFAYDVSRLSKTDPKLIGYERVAQFKSPRQEARRMVCGPDKRLYLAAGKYVTIMTLGGELITEFALAAPGRCVAVAADGLVYVSLRDHVEVFNGQGQRRAAWDSPGQRAWITGLAVTRNEVFAADAGNRVLWRYDRAGKVVKRIGERDSARHIPGLVIPSPYCDVEIHPDGLLRLTNPGRHQVEAYTVDGDLELSWGKPAAAIDGFCGCCNPINLAVLPDGRLVTCEKGLPRVKVYSVRGEFQTVVVGAESFPENAQAGAGDDRSDGVLSGLDATVDPSGRIYVLDMVTSEIQILAPKAGKPA